MSEIKPNDGVQTPEGVENPENIKSDANANIDADKLIEVNSNLIAEIKELRKQKQEAEEAARLAAEQKANATPETPESEEDKIAKAVRAVLNQEKAEKAKANKQAAFERFVTSNKDFHPDNDPTGMRRQALENKLARFNMSDLNEVEDFEAVIKEAHLLLGRSDNASGSTGEIQNPYASTTKSSVAPEENPNAELPDAAKKLIARGSLTKERYLKLQQDNPDYLRQILESVR